MGHFTHTHPSDTLSPHPTFTGASPSSPLIPHPPKYVSCFWAGTGLQQHWLAWRNRGATTFSKLGVQFLGLGYYSEQNMDGIPSFVHCSVLRNGNHTLHQESWGGGSGPPPRPPSVCAVVKEYNKRRTTASIDVELGELIYCTMSVVVFTLCQYNWVELSLVGFTNVGALFDTYVGPELWPWLPFSFIFRR